MYIESCIDRYDYNLWYKTARESQRIMKKAWVEDISGFGMGNCSSYSSKLRGNFLLNVAAAGLIHSISVTALQSPPLTSYHWRNCPSFSMILPAVNCSVSDGHVFIPLIGPIPYSSTRYHSRWKTSIGNDPLRQRRAMTESNCLKQEVCKFPMMKHLWIVWLWKEMI